VSRDRIVRAWTIAWLGGALVGVANGVARQLLYADRVGDRAAQQLSTGTGLALFSGYFTALNRRWPLRSGRQALAVGAIWLVLTEVFELGFGHWVDRKSWDELVVQHDVRKGNLWPLLLVWLGLGPAAIRRVTRSGG
jgi:hypothetical protein